MFQITELFYLFCRENNLSLTISYNMPKGYETAFGTYDVTINTLFLNLKMLENAPEYEVLFYFYHELRHAEQYLHAERFDLQFQESLPYVVLYNGVCYKLIGNVWHECQLDGIDFADAYLSLPYELDANRFAYEKVKELCGESQELQNLYHSCLPTIEWNSEKLKILFEQIEARI